MKLHRYGRAVRTSKVEPGVWGVLPIDGKMCFGLTVVAEESGDPPEFVALSHDHPFGKVPSTAASQYFFGKTLFVFDEAVAVPNHSDMRFGTVADVGGLIPSDNDIGLVVLGNEGLRTVSLSTGAGTRGGRIREAVPVWFGSWRVQNPFDRWLA